MARDSSRCAISTSTKLIHADPGAPEILLNEEQSWRVELVGAMIWIPSMRCITGLKGNEFRGLSTFALLRTNVSMRLKDCGHECRNERTLHGEAEALPLFCADIETILDKIFTPSIMIITCQGRTSVVCLTCPVSFP